MLHTTPLFVRSVTCMLSDRLELVCVELSYMTHFMARFLTLCVVSFYRKWQSSCVISTSRICRLR